METFHHILFATDFGDAAAHAEETAVSLARAFDARLTVMHVYTIPATAYNESIVWPMAELEAAAQGQLDDAAKRIQLSYPKCESFLDCGVPADRIVAAVAARKVDLVVMGTHGRRGLSRVFLGSVAERVVRTSAVPVLTVPGRPGSTAH